MYFNISNGIFFHVVDALRFTSANGGGLSERGNICSEGSGSQRLDKICLKVFSAAWYVKKHPIPLKLNQEYDKMREKDKN